MAPLGIVESEAAWYGPAIEHSTDWQHRLSADQRAEVGRAVEHLQATGRQLLETTRADFPLPTVGPLHSLNVSNAAAVALSIARHVSPITAPAPAAT